jgi:hypothetical protein
MGSGYIAPSLLDLGTSWRGVVSFMPMLRFPRGKSPRYPLDRKWGGSQSRHGQYGEVKTLHSIGTRTPTLSNREEQNEHETRLSFPFSFEIMTALILTATSSARSPKLVPRHRYLFLEWSRWNWLRIRSRRKNFKFYDNRDITYAGVLLYHELVCISLTLFLFLTMNSTILK